MVSKKDIKGLEFSSLDEYFEYIIVSTINGNNSQVKNLINKLSKEQKKTFIYFCGTVGDSLDVSYCKDLCLIEM